MMALPVRDLPTGNWIYEMKFDGYKALAIKPGRRSGAWVKVKLTQQQEFVIGGYTPPEGSRKYFGALLVGYYGPEGLLFAGRVGTGFSERALEPLYDGFQKIRRSLCPFVNLPERTRCRWGLGITPAVMRTCSCVEPVLVAGPIKQQKKLFGSSY